MAQELTYIFDPLDWAIDVVFVAECLLNFRTTYHIEETNELVTNARAIGAMPAPCTCSTTCSVTMHTLSFPHMQALNHACLRDLF